jgi:hypothetical protein
MFVKITPALMPKFSIELPFESYNDHPKIVRDDNGFCFQKREVLV